jgi:hypothetical protein
MQLEMIKNNESGQVCQNAKYMFLGVDQMSFPVQIKEFVSVGMVNTCAL